MALQGVNFKATKVGGHKQKPGVCFCCGKDGNYKGQCPKGKQRPPSMALPHMQVRSLEE